ncbi:hypothetical protein EVAR_11813_1 [Eumeta japonica]|uniref:Uncharacterized protein n=1 Tax=Eumeta variegata TaxID=151549 RepID=A0A4C1UQ56_EUMVA|nr:hypothetical protein EVAR_11813_1 [Eumeta japonica]
MDATPFRLRGTPKVPRGFTTAPVGATPTVVRALDADSADLHLVVSHYTGRYNGEGGTRACPHIGPFLCGVETREIGRVGVGARRPPGAPRGRERLITGW